MLFSRFTYPYKVADGVVALYHSLFVVTVFLSEKEIEAIKDSPYSSESIKSRYQYLYDNFFVIECASVDDTIYATFCSSIPRNHFSNVYIITTLNCNFNCSYCFISESRARKATKVMTNDIAQKAISFLNDTFDREPTQEKRVITFYGGEPLLNLNVIKFFVERIESLSTVGLWNHPVQFGVITNGSLLDKATLSFLKSHGISLGISFDLIPPAHKNRVLASGRDTFLLVEDSIRLCVEQNLDFTLSITITEPILANQETAIDKIVSLRPTYVSLNMLIPNENNMELSYYDRATDFIIRAYKRLREFGIGEDRTMRKVNSFVSHSLYLYDCCASGAGQIVISPDGRIGICHAYLNSGKFFDSCLNEKGIVIEDSPTFKAWKNRTPIFMHQCLSCECLAICGGGCPYSADKMHGSIHALDERFCIHAKKMLRWMISELYQNSCNTKIKSI